ncbi:MAG: polyprenyl synthetase family protein [Clostridia bacterium]|nr:polyprenyl synthetase family protein [Clostridia bacterium]MBQ4543571.1 polyprenyl synthetase family protein [Clostridia bacterium]MBQ7075743.1 polyprenyl synthetase family protein [Clostridia bacterium]
MDFLNQLKNDTEIVEEWLNELSPKGDGYHGIIFESANYSISNGGKRIRPVLTMEVCKLFGGDIENVKHFACALEFIHTYSLIHDDLPCMDNDDLRRGKPTNHKVYGDAIAVLAGDGLLTYAFETVLNSPCDKKAEAGLCLAKLAGFDGMVGGQVIDIKGATNKEMLIDLHKRKTGALICAGAYLGAISAGAEGKDIDNVMQFAENLGLAFQIKDDLLDVLGDEKTLGKPIGSDLNKQTFVDFYGVEKATEKLNEISEKAKDIIFCYGEKSRFLTELTDYLINRNY